MKKNIFLWPAFALLVIIFCSFALASYSADVPEFIKMYGPGASLEGILNLSLANESADLSMTATFDEIVKSISIKDLLKNAEVEYSCIPSDCTERYSKGDASSSKTIGPGTEYLAFVIENGNGVMVNGVQPLLFNITGNGGVESCGSPPISMDILDDGSVDWYYSESSENRCYSLEDGKGSSYDPSRAGYDADLTDSPSCEKINLEMAGQFELSVDMKNGSEELVKLSIKDAESGDEAPCEANATEGITSCIVNFTSSEEKDYYVCVSSSFESNHKIKSEIRSPTCGYGFSPSEDVRAFQCSETSTDYGIYAVPMKIAPFNNTAMFDKNSFLSSEAMDLSEYLQDYIDLKYGGNCNKSCIIPVKFDLAQTVVLSGLSFKYSASSLGPRTQQSFYDSSRTPAKISVNRTIMELSSSEITVPSEPGDYSFTLKMGDRTLKNLIINVEEVPRIVSLTPLEVEALVPATFDAVVTSPKNNSIKSYYWDYGDGGFDTTSVPSTTHSYGMGTFRMTVRATDSENLTGAKIFEIIAGAPKMSLETMLKNKRANINALKLDLAKIPSWYQGLAIEMLNLNKLSTDLAILEADFASSTAEYDLIKNSLDYFVVYSSIKDEDIGSSPVVASVDLSYFEPVGEILPSGRDAEIIESLNDWNRKVVMKVNYVVKYAQSDISSESNLDLLTIANINIGSDYNGQAYFVVKLPDGADKIKLNGNYSVMKVDNALVFTFDDLKSRNIELAIPGRQLDLQMFAFPPLSELLIPSVTCGNGKCESGEDYKSCDADCNRPIWVPILWSFLIWCVVIGGVYWIWKYYAKKYDLEMQEKLFKQKSDYTILVSFIAEELNKGSGGTAIRKELSDAGWKNDQIEYAMKKVLKQTLDFQRQTVLEFIIKEIGTGKLEGEIADELKKAGWSGDLISYGFKKFKKMQRRKRF